MSSSSIDFVIKDELLFKKFLDCKYIGKGKKVNRYIIDGLMIPDESDEE